MQWWISKSFALYFLLIIFFQLQYVNGFSQTENLSGERIIQFVCKYDTIINIDETIIPNSIYFKKNGIPVKINYDYKDNTIFIHCIPVLRQAGY